MPRATTRITRRQALAGLSAAAASLLVAACGGTGAPVGASPSASSAARTSASSASGSASVSASASAATSAAGKAKLVDLTGAGATFPFPLYSKWFDEYNKLKGVKINYQSIGSGGGIEQIKKKTVDFGASDAPLSDEQLKDFSAPLAHVPTVGGAVAIAYNVPGLGKPLNLTPEALSGIYLGTIKKWDDPKIVQDNPGAKLAGDIAVAYRSDGSGTTNIFTSYLAAVSKDWADKVGKGTSVKWPVGIGGKGNEGVTGVVKQAPGGIGYVELAYADQNKLPVASMKNQTGKFVAPGVDSAAAAIAGSLPAMQKDVRVVPVNAAGDAAYPIVGVTYILLYKEQADEGKGRTLVDFLTWAMQDGEKLAPSLLYVPLDASVVKINMDTLKGITYQGKSLA